MYMRPSNSRGHVTFDWLDTYHTFSFGHYHDPAHMGFGPLRVINEDRISAGAGFPPHGHQNMEIITYVLEGAVAHRDSSGGEGVIRPGEVQLMHAGSGITHSEYNHELDAATHLLQIWLMPDKANVKPGYQQKTFPLEERWGTFKVLASPDGRSGSLHMHQDGLLLSAVLDGGEHTYTPATDMAEAGRQLWVQIARGSATVNGTKLVAGDGLGLDLNTPATFTEAKGAEVLVFDLPL